MTYHPIIGILIFLITIIFSFFLGKNAFKKYKSKSHNSHLQGMNPNKKTSSPPKGDATSPDAPWLND